MVASFMKIAFALPGLHRIDRGAEIAFMSIADELALRGHDVTLFGSGEVRPGKAYRFVHVGCIRRENFERWPKLPMFRDETAYEELTFAAALLTKFLPGNYDIVGGCSYPFLNWLLRRPVLSGPRPRYVFVTQNGDHPATAGNSEYKFFGCDGIVCINPDFLARNKDHWNAVLIPNGVKSSVFKNSVGDRKGLGLPENKKIALMVSALIASKRVDKAIEAVARIEDLHLVVAGDGPEREKIALLAAQLLPGRFTRVTLAPGDMPRLYHSADVFLHMSQAEAFGNVFVEALACGRPVVAHDIPRHRWVVGDTGFFADTESVDATASALHLALASGSGERQKRINWVDRYDWKLVADQYETFFASLLAGRKA
jgi:glycosyltransferase involved in cell wall biosynthesis